MDWLSNLTKEQVAALEQPVTDAQMKAYRRQTGLSRWALGFDVSLANSVVLVIGWIAFCISTVIMMLLVPHWLTQVFMLSGLAAMAGVIFFRASQRAVRRHVRMSDYAARCGMQYDPIGKTHAIGMGLLFDVGHSRRYRGVLWYEQDGQRQLEIGRYRYTVGHGKNQQTYHWRYAAVRLARALPHIIIDSKNNDTNFLNKTLLSSLPVIISNSQRVSLEGDFDNYFTLYAPKQYGADVRYILTPDVMAALVDEAANFDMEIIDDVLLFYTRIGDESDAEAMKNIYHVLSLVGREIYAQTDYYTDDRVKNASQRNVVDRRGQRLKYWKKAP